MPEIQQPLTIDNVRAALRSAVRPPLPGLRAQITMAPRPRPLRPAPGVEPRQAGVLLLLYPAGEELTLLLTVRTSALHHHSGQISLPGGGWEEGDGSLKETAMREAREEVGSLSDQLEMIGPLTELYVPPSNNCVHPFVAYTPLRPAFDPDPCEVADLLEVPLSLFLDPSTRREEVWMRQGEDYHVPFYSVGEHKVWGATAMILAELVALLEGGSP